MAANLAAVAADEARNTLLIDLNHANLASAALKTRRDPGIEDVVTGGASWPDVTVAARVGRLGKIPVASHHFQPQRCLEGAPCAEVTYGAF